jgi:hypothetical protein
VDQPYLVGGKKFDLRIYALVTSYNPLRIYLYRWGAGLLGEPKSVMGLTVLQPGAHCCSVNAPLMSRGHKWGSMCIKV